MSDEARELAETEENIDSAATDNGPFVLTEDSLTYRGSAVSGPVWVIAEARDSNSNGWSKLLKFEDRDGNHQYLLMPLSALAGHGIEALTALVSRGFDLPRDPERRSLVLDYIDRCYSDVRIRITDKTGWHDEVFVLPDPEDTIGNPTETYRLTGQWAENHAYKAKGTLEEWKDGVASKCKGNSRLMFAVSAAFTAPLLHLLGVENGGFHLVGQSSTGKTTALRVAASVWGRPEYLRSWRATDNGMEGMAKAHNDALLILDEIGQMDPQKLGDVAYMLTNGAAKVRASRTGESKPASTWRVLTLSSGEVDLDTHIKSGRKTSTGGQEVRLVSFPADAGKGLGVFEDAHDSASPADFAKALTAATRNAYGTPSRAFIAWLVENAEKAVQKAVKARYEFARSNAPTNATGEVLRVLDRFALVAAGGELAIDAGVAPWTQGDAAKAVATCFQAWLDNRDGTGARDETSAIAQIKRCIERDGDARFPKVNDEPGTKKFIRTVPNRLGFKMTVHDDDCYFFLAGQFREEICKGFNVRTVAKALKDRGLLLTNEPDRNTYKPSEIPGLGRPRGFLIKASILEYDSG